LALNQQLGIPGLDQAARVDQAAVMEVVMEVQFLQARPVAVIPRLG